MFDFLIVGIVFSFLTVCVFLDYSNKKNKDKIEAALRMEEMRRGYQPGTYSFKFNKRKMKKTVRNFDQESVINERNLEREDLKGGIDDLMTRINNLETIMKAEENK